MNERVFIRFYCIFNTRLKNMGPLNLQWQCGMDQWDLFIYSCLLFQWRKECDPWQSWHLKPTHTHTGAEDTRVISHFHLSHCRSLTVSNVLHKRLQETLRLSMNFSLGLSYVIELSLLLMIEKTSYCLALMLFTHKTHPVCNSETVTCVHMWCAD